MLHALQGIHLKLFQVNKEKLAIWASRMKKKKQKKTIMAVEK